ncbi:MAG: Flp pilus assembly protein CpaB [Gemmatimonadetes bacterium]|nr:Flp pilus assembly protein CpaB [Gemmatimonadota bacterium]
MRSRSILILSLAAICGLLAALMAKRYLQTQIAMVPSAQSATSLVAVAARDLPGGSVLKAEDVKLVAWPVSARPAEYLASVEPLVGQGLLFPVKANEPLLRSKMSGEQGGLAAVIPQGMRAVSVKVDEVIAVAGFVVPGTRVDVLVTMPPSSGQPGTSRVVLQSIRVLASGQSFEESSEGEPKDASVITLLVTPDEAEVLLLASNEGRIQLALRNSLDEAVAITRGSVATQNIRSSGVPAPRAAQTTTRATSPRATTPRINGSAVEIYNGSARTVANF